MLARRNVYAPPLTRRDAVRLLVAAVGLIVPLAAILSLDILPSGVSLSQGDVAPTDVRAPRTIEFTSQGETDQARVAARNAVAPQYDYTPQRGEIAAAQQSRAFDRAVSPVDAAFNAVLTEETRVSALGAAMPALSTDAKRTLQGLERRDWEALRREMQQVLEETQRQEIRDTVLPATRSALGDRLDPSLPSAQRSLATEILSPLIVANSTYDAAATAVARELAGSRVQPVAYTIKQGELIVQAGRRIQATDLEKLGALGLLDPHPDLVRLVGWFGLASLAVGLLLTWLWRFRPAVWHRDNALLLVGVVLVVATLVMRITADRPILPFVAPVAAAALLVAVLLDSSAGVVLMAVLGVLAGVIGSSVEQTVYVFMGGFAGIVVVRRGERLSNFLQAGLAMGLVNGTVVTIFALLGERDLPGVLQLWAASMAAAGGAAIAAVGTLPVLGNLFGITTSLQLLELANPSQPLLRRLLLETSGTYHHSLMVGNLSERAAEAIGADPLLARVAAYYHDVGKLADPLAFIENQGGGDNLHDDLTPEQSAAVLKAHVTNGIDLAYRYRLPKAVIAFIPQHHGTALMSYFYARAREHAVAEAGARPGSPQAISAEASVDQRRFRHAGPKPQSREAAILMLADGVEAAVRSLTSHDAPAIRTMVERIFRERLDDRQFDECDLTLGDLERIKEAFISQLIGVYHRRIEYPQNKIVELESRRPASGAGR